jgi:hypothetical protein
MNVRRKNCTTSVQDLHNIDHPPSSLPSLPQESAITFVLDPRPPPPCFVRHAAEIRGFGFFLWRAAINLAREELISCQEQQDHSHQHPQPSKYDTQRPGGAVQVLKYIVGAMLG